LILIDKSGGAAT